MIRAIREIRGGFGPENPKMAGLQAFNYESREWREWGMDSDPAGVSHQDAKARRSFRRTVSRLAPFALFARGQFRDRKARKPIYDGFRSGSRLSPRTPRTRRSFRKTAGRLAPFAFFAREILRNRPVWGPKITILGPKWPENGVFRRVFPIFTCAARCGSFPLTIFCRRHNLRLATRDI